MINHSYLKGTLVYFILVIFQINIRAFSQPIANNFPKIGDRCPDFILKDLHYYSKKTAKSTEFRGKPVILDFFSVGCEACFASFPALNRLKKEFEGRVQFFLIAKKSRGLQKQYEKFIKHYKLSLPVEYDDSTIWNQFGVLLVPYTVWIDSIGIIRQISTSFALTRDRLNSFIQGKRLELTVSLNQNSQKNEENGYMFYDPKKPFLIGGNGGLDTAFSYRSVFANWDSRSYFHRDLFISSKNKSQVNEIGVPLEVLYNLAYGDTVNSIYPTDPEEEKIGVPNQYGKWARTPLIESARKYLFDYDIDSARNVFSYSLKIPDSLGKPENLQKIMRRDLESYFHFRVSVETRKMPCWKLVADSDKVRLLKSKGGNPEYNADFTSLSMTNLPFLYVLAIIWGSNQREDVFIDETGIDFNIDLKMNCIWLDLNDIKRELIKNGFDLVKAEKEMKVIVVRDNQ
jgi:thiol-disulfide isomerase/thioredoxin